MSTALTHRLIPTTTHWDTYYAEAEGDRLRSQATLRHEELAALDVTADMTGVLQLLPVEVGAQVQPGTRHLHELARQGNGVRHRLLEGLDPVRADERVGVMFRRQKQEAHAAQIGGKAAQGA